MAIAGWTLRTPAVPVTYLGAVLGLGGLGNAWRAAHRIWNVPALVGECISLVTLVVRLVCGLGFIRAWLAESEIARGDFRDPARAPFAALLPMSTMIAGFALKPYAPAVSGIVVGVGRGCQVLVGVRATASLWRGGRDDEAVTPILLMLTVGGFFVGTIAAVQVVGPSLGVLFFGAGLMSWMVMESVVLHRLVNRTLPPAHRATLGIHLTPPAIACVAYLELGDASPDRFVLKRETTETSSKVASAYEKLAAKFRKRMEKADDKAEAPEKEGKQQALRRRSKLFGKAAKELEGKVAKLKRSLIVTSSPEWERKASDQGFRVDFFD